GTASWAWTRSSSNNRKVFPGSGRRVEGRRATLPSLPPPRALRYFSPLDRHGRDPRDRTLGVYFRVPEVLLIQETAPGRGGVDGREEDEGQGNEESRSEEAHQDR